MSYTLTDPNGFNYVDYKGRIRWEGSNGGAMYYGIMRLHEWAFKHRARLRLENIGHATWTVEIIDAKGNPIVQESIPDEGHVKFTFDNAGHINGELADSEPHMSGALHVIVAAIHALEKIDPDEHKIGAAKPHRMTEWELEEEND